MTHAVSVLRIPYEMTLGEREAGRLFSAVPTLHPIDMKYELGNLYYSYYGAGKHTFLRFQSIGAPPEVVDGMTERQVLEALIHRLHCKGTSIEPAKSATIRKHLVAALAQFEKE